MKNQNVKRLPKDKYPIGTWAIYIPVKQIAVECATCEGSGYEKLILTCSFCGGVGSILTDYCWS